MSNKSEDNIFMRTLLFTSLLVIASFSLSACGVLKPYQTPLHQGHQLSDEQLDALEVGLSPTQVRSLLGSPLLPAEIQAQQEIWFYPLDQGDRQTGMLRLVFEQSQLQSWATSD